MQNKVQIMTTHCKISGPELAYLDSPSNKGEVHGIIASIYHFRCLKDEVPGIVWWKSSFLIVYNA